MSNGTQTDNFGKLLWDYLQLDEMPESSDIIFCLCSHDTRVAERASELMLNGFGEYLVFSGGVGKLTEDLFIKSEAETIANIARKNGVNNERIILEDKSTNTGENIQFTYKLLKKRRLPYDSMILVQKPYMERRTLATFLKQWPGKDTKIHVTSPKLSYKDYVNNSAVPKEEIIHIMVGDIQRIREYPKIGFQVEQEIPDDVWDAFNELVDLGFDKHLISKSLE